MSLFLSLFSFLVSGVINTGGINLNEDEAYKIAESFFSRTSSSRRNLTNKTSNPSSKRLARLTDVKGQTSYYVYGFPDGGFVIVSGYTAAHPILAYSVNGTFNEYSESEGGVFMLDFFSSTIDEARKNNIAPSPRIAQEWITVQSMPEEPQVLLETASWSQLDPFNRLCPVVNGTRCPTGCVNTAMAIIMRYYKWPEMGNGVLPDYTAGDNNYTGHSLGHKYDWGNMPLRYDVGQYTETQANEVSQLMFDLGIMSQSNYSPGNTGAVSTSPFRLATYFDYDADMQYYHREFFSDTEWETIIKRELDMGRPVFYCGYVSTGATYDGSGGGHAFVINGYNNRYFSFNFGWGANSVFQILSPLDETEEEILVSAAKKGHEIVTGIKPNEGGQYTGCSLNSSSFILTNWSHKILEEFWIAPFWISNYSSAFYSCELAYGLVDNNGIIKEIISEPYAMSFQPGDYLAIPETKCIIKTNIDLEDSIRLLYRNETSSEWGCILNTGKYPMYCGKTIREATSFTVKDNNTEPIEESRRCISISFPLYLSCYIYDNSGVCIFPTEKGIYEYEQDFSVKFSGYSVDIQKIKGLTPQKYTIKFFDLVEEESIDVIF